MGALLKPRRSFRHGVHPPDAKTATCDRPIQRFPFAPVLMVPLSQHAGKPSIAVVREGQEVVRGEVIARADGFVSVPMHAPVSGTVARLGLIPSNSGRMVPGIYLRAFPGSTQEVARGQPCDLATATPAQIIDAIQQAGIVGLGGAAFPTHVKLRIPDGKHVDTLIVNGVECEPFLTTDHRVMLEQTEDIYTGIRYLMRCCGVERVIIGVEANKADAAEMLSHAKPADLDVEIQVLTVKYPQGAEKMLISALLGREVPSGGLPMDVHAICINVATTAEIGRLLPHGRGIQERVITVSGPGVGRPGNYRIPVGTPLRFLLEQCDAREDMTEVFMGGPMMGPSVASLDIPVVKGTSGVVAFSAKQTGTRPQRVYPCIRCGYCVDACPIFLNPSTLGILARHGDYMTMADDWHLMDCFECGSCTYVCPSHIPLVQYFRLSKRMVREARTP